MFSCIYCKKSEPIVSPSEAHIFPDAMGGINSTQDTVCKDCNHLINSRFEQLEVSRFAYFQSIWGIKSRRNRIQSVPAKVTHEGKQFNISLDNSGMPKAPLVFCEKDSNGESHYNVIGPSHLVEEKRKEIEKKVQGIRWKEKELNRDQLPESVIEIASDIKRATLRRLAAKVAFERWGQLRNSYLLSDQQYDSIRNFILNGDEPAVICGNLFDIELLNSMLNFPAGHHAVVVNAHPRSNILGAFVAFYSLFYFWVVISSSFKAISPIDDPLIEDPQIQKDYKPIFRANTGHLLIHWDRIANPCLRDPHNVEVKAMRFAINKLQSSVAKVFDSNGMRHVLAQHVPPADR